MSQKNVLIFCVGRDLLEGTVLDRNAHFMADRISDLAYRVQSIQVLDDREDEMVAAFQNALAQKPAFMLVTGGMGPGHDDLTRESMAKATREIISATIATNSAVASAGLLSLKTDSP